eukprot:gene1912-2170_t
MFVRAPTCDEQRRDKGLPIVPLKVKGAESDNSIKTYVLLESGSTASFCSEVLLKELGVTGTKHQTSVATISGVDTNYQTSVVSLEMMNLEETQCLQMPNIFSTKTMNILNQRLPVQKK